MATLYVKSSVTMIMHKPNHNYVQGFAIKLLIIIIGTKMQSMKIGNTWHNNSTTRFSVTNKAKHTQHRKNELQRRNLCLLSKMMALRFIFLFFPEITVAKVQLSVLHFIHFNFGFLCVFVLFWSDEFY